MRQLNAGVDMIVAQGSEAGGHTGTISTLVLVPEVLDVVAGRIPVLAAGGIVTGAQMARHDGARRARGLDGSVWLTTEEAETAPATKDKMLHATASDTVRSRGRTGKPARQLRSDWTDAWERAGRAGSLAHAAAVDDQRAGPAPGRRGRGRGTCRRDRLATYFVGQGVGLLHTVKPAARVVQEFMEDFAAAAERLQQTLE